MTQERLNGAIVVALAALAAIQASDPQALGLTPEVKNWLAILASALGVLAGLLRPPQGSDG